MSLSRVRRRERAVRLILPVGVIVLLAIAALIELRPIERGWTYMQENRQYNAHPSALLAYQIGNRHLDSASYPEAYDIDRAEYFFRLAVTQDPRLPYVYHELARIAFLRGDFEAAMAYIDIQIENQGDKTPNSYYIRGLIEGFMGRYADAERDYARYLAFDPINWAAVNDYSWVLLKDGKPKETAAVIEKVIAYFPKNPWLLNSDAIALSEIGDLDAAKLRIHAAHDAMASLTPEQWSAAYPGNDPRIASQGLDAFRNAVEGNMHSIDAGNAAHAIQ